MNNMLTDKEEEATTVETELSQDDSEVFGAPVEEERSPRSRPSQQAKKNSANPQQITRLAEALEKQSSQLERISRVLDKQLQLSHQVQSSMSELNGQMRRLHKTSIAVTDWINSKKAKKEKKRKEKKLKSEKNKNRRKKT
jgi:hypothetical protein